METETGWREKNRTCLILVLLLLFQTLSKTGTHSCDLLVCETKTRLGTYNKWMGLTQQTVTGIPLNEGVF